MDTGISRKKGTTGNPDIQYAQRSVWNNTFCKNALVSLFLLVKVLLLQVLCLMWGYPLSPSECFILFVCWVGWFVSNYTKTT